MPLRVPPGRAGRIWLGHRLEVARRGADVLDQKRRALVRLRRDLEDDLEGAAAEWRDEATAASDWLARATVLSGQRRLGLALAYTGVPAETHVSWQNSLGVVHPTSCRLDLPEPLDVASLGGGAALVTAADAHRRALVAAARFAVVKTAYDRASRELAATARRSRAVEHRFIPQHEAALLRLKLSLDEGEREEATRTRWIKGRRAHPG